MQLSLALATFLVVSLAWVLFRARDLGDSLSLLTSMFGLRSGDSLLSQAECTRVLLVVAALFAVHWLLRESRLERVVERLPWWLTALGLAAAAISLLVTPGEDRAFIYFQF